MKNIIYSELSRNLSRKKNIILFLTSIIVLLLLSLFNHVSMVGFYSPDRSISLNSLNFSVFVLKDFHLFVCLIFSPMILVDMFNHEYTSGAYRMVMTRQYSKLQLYIGKIISASIILLLFTFVVYIVSSIYGILFLPKVSFTTYFDIDKNLDIIQSIIYNFKFYFLEYGILISILSVTSLISLLSPNAVIGFILTIITFIGALYIDTDFSFFLFNNQGIFDTLSGINISLIFYILVVSMISISMSVFVFSKKDYLY